MPFKLHPIADPW